MGPKKGGKKTKAELAEEKLAKELEEKKQRELEEKRALAEAEKRRLEDIRIQELRRGVRETELDRLRAEHEALLVKEEIRLKRLRAEDEVESKRVEWVSVLNPVNVPNPQSERDLNTFISVTTSLNTSSVSEMLDTCRRVEAVARSMQAKWSDDLARGDPSAQATSLRYVETLLKIIMDKLDEATLYLLRFADQHVNEKSELNVEEAVGSVCIGMWAHYPPASPPMRKSIVFEKMGFQIDVPKQILQQDTRFVHRVVRFPWEHLSWRAYHPDSAQPEFTGNTTKYVIGELYNVELLIPPPPATRMRAKRWTMRDVSDSSLRLRRPPAYPSSVPTKCQIRVPETLVMTGSTRVMLWDPEAGDWTETGIADYHWNETERTVQFYMTCLDTVALVRDRVADLPYTSWSLRAVRDAPSASGEEEFYGQHARFTLSTSSQRLVIDVLGAQCKLVEPSDRTTADLSGQLMSPGNLLLALLRKGIYILPTEHDIVRAVRAYSASDGGEGGLVDPKNRDLELAVLHQISLTANTIDFEGSPAWNKSLGPAQVGLLAQEATVFSCADESFDMESLLAELDAVSETSRHAPGVGTLPEPGVKYTLVHGNEYGMNDTYSIAPRPGEAAHLEALAAMSSRVTPEGRARAAGEGVTCRFQRAVYTLLKLIRLVTVRGGPPHYMSTEI